MKYSLVACGGTFDRLHLGHKVFLTFAFSLGKKVIIGITSDTYIAQNKSGQGIAPFTQRKKNIETYLTQNGFIQRAEIISIDTSFGPTLSETFSIDALVVTAETYDGAVSINQKRQELGLSPLPIESMDIITKNNEKISSSAIRKGVIDETGEIIINPSWLHHPLVLPEKLRLLLQEPFGTLFSGDISHVSKISPEYLVTVGDVTTQKIHSMGIHPKIAVIDFLVERKKSLMSLADLGFTNEEKQIGIVNPPGHIMPKVWKTLQEVVNHLNQYQEILITVDGEEDLCVLPLVLLLPNNFTILYGQPQKGMVEVPVTYENKMKVRDFISQFTQA